MAAVRQHLPAIEVLHDEGASWVDIAAGLTAQGLVQGNGAPLTGRWLTALIASIRRQDMQRAAKVAKRAGRTDLWREPAAVAARPSLALAPELRTASPEPDRSIHDAEAEIRLEKLRRVEGFFKPDPSNEDR